MYEQLYDFKKYGFRLCFNDGCNRKNDCLRYYVWRNCTRNHLHITCINHLCEEIKEECQYFRPIQPVKLAYGFDRAMYDELPKKKSEQLWNKIHEHFGNTEYYRYLKGEKPLLPQQQEYLEREFRNAGYEGRFLYLRTEEDYDMSDTISYENSD